MENDQTGDNEKELTSTSSPIGKLGSTNPEEKNDSNDTLPTSSTDANIFSDNILSQSVSEDPISSTSNEMDSTKVKTTAEPSVDVPDRASTIDTDAELLGISISAEPHEKIEENVYDLVNDLETLLGESTDVFTIPSRPTPALQEKTEAKKCSLPNQKTENEVSSNTDVAAVKSALPGEVNLVELETLQPCNVPVDSETPMEVETVEDKTESSETPMEVETVEDKTELSDKTNEEPKIDNGKKEVVANEEQSQLVCIEEEKLEQSALVEALSGEVVKEAVESENELVSANIEQTALEDNPNEEESTPVSQETTQEAVIAEEPKIYEKQIEVTKTVEDSHSKPNVEEPKLVTDSSEETTSEELNIKANEEEQGTKTAEEPTVHEEEEEVKPVSKIDDEEKQETVTPEEVNHSEENTIASKVSEKEKQEIASEQEQIGEDDKKAKQEVETPEELNIKASEELKPSSEVYEEENQNAASMPDLKDSEEKLSPTSEVYEEENQIAASMLDLKDSEEKHSPTSEVHEEGKQTAASTEEPKDSEKELNPISEVQEEEKQEATTTEEPNSKENEEELKPISTDVEMESAEEAPEILILEEEKEVEDQSSSIPESDIQEACKVDQAEPEQSVSSDICESEKIQQDVENSENVSASTPPLPEEVKMDEITEAKPEPGDDHLTPQPEISCEKVDTVEETTTTEVIKDSTSDLNEVPTEKSPETENIILPVESENICNVSSEETVEQSITEGSVTVEPLKEERKAARITEEIEITELIEATIPEDVEIIEADPVVEEPEETNAETEEMASIPEIVETVAEPVEIQVIEKDETAIVEESEPDVIQEVPATQLESTVGESEESTAEISTTPADEPNKTIEETPDESTQEILLTNSTNKVEDSKNSETPQVSSVLEPVQESKMIVDEPEVITKESQPVIDEVECTDESKLAVEELSVDKAESAVDQSAKEPDLIIPVEETEALCTDESKLAVEELSVDKAESAVDQFAKEPELIIPVEETEAFDVAEISETEAIPIVEDIPIEMKSSDVLPTLIDVDEAVVASKVEVVEEPVIKIAAIHNEETSAENIPKIVEVLEVKLDETIAPSEETLTERIAEVIGESVVKLDEPDEVINLIEDSLEVPSDITQTIDNTTLILTEETSVLSKPLPEMRRKTVEQDLEKVVCLSEESSDSDDAAPVITTAKPLDEEQPFEIDQLLESQIGPCESQDIPEIEEILAEQPTSIEAAVESTSSFETILAVASLQNEVVPSAREDRRLSDKEIQEMEAIRMAVASITDSSQDTYDSFLVDGSVPLQPPEVADVPSIEGLLSEDAMQATNEDSSEKLVGEKPELNKDISIFKEVSSPEKDEMKDLDKAEPNEVPVEVQPNEKIESTIPEVEMTADSAKEASNKTPVSEKLPVAAISTMEPELNVAVPHTVEVENAPVLVEKPPSSSAVVADTLEVEKLGSVESVKDETPVIPEVSEAEKKLIESVESIAQEEGSKCIKTPELTATEITNLENTKVNCISATTTEITDSKEIPVENKQSTEERPSRTRSRRGNKVSEPLSINVDEVERKEVCSPKITIKPVKVPEEEISTSSASETESSKGSLKMTITKQADKMHSILKVFNPDEEVHSPQSQEEPIPKLIIKQVQQIEQQQHSPKMSTRSSKGYSPTSPRCSSPRVTIKPVPKPGEVKNEAALSPLKITLKHSPKPPKDSEKNHNPKITIKLIPKPTETEKEETVTTPKVTIKPLKRPAEEAELDIDQERSSPKITIKPVIKPPDHDSEQTAPSTPKLKIKPVKKYEEEESVPQETEHSSPKISIKPVVKPLEQEDEEMDDVKERIVLKINRGNLPVSGRESKKREYPEDDKAEKVGIKLKFSTTGGHTHIVQGVEESNKRQRKDSGYSSSVAVRKEGEEPTLKRPLEDRLPEKNKRLRNSISPEKLINNELFAKVDPAVDLLRPSEDQDISTIASLASQTTHIGASPVLTVGVVTPTVTPLPKRRGRPRKVPLEVRPELSTPEISPAPSTVSSDVESPIVTPPVEGRPKRSCRGQNVMATLGIKPRKPRGRGRGSKVNMGDRTPPVVQTPLEPVVEETVPVIPKKDPVNPDNGESSRREEETEEKTFTETLQETPFKKKKEDKTPVRKLEVTTRRQKAQLHKEEGENSAELKDETVSKPPEIVITLSETPTRSEDTSTDDVEFVSEKKYKLDEKLQKQKEFLERSAPHENEIEIITIEDDSKNPDDLDEEDESSDEESESEKRRAYVLKKKQEALRKCREKRKEKLARVAEMKKKRMQQREAKKAAEEAEKAAAEKARATKRYGRYGVPKPQISLVDQPALETPGTVKPGSVTEDENSDKDRPGLLTPVKSSNQSSECMLVDPLEETPVKRPDSIGSEDVVMVDEETRMSADLRSSRAQTPAKQPISSEVIVVEDSQGSVCTEGGKSRSSKAPKMEVFQDLESVFTADQLAEYSWNGQGPFMLQEQVTQYLAIKSFKRKYPNVTRRAVDMQERDFLKENHLVTESQCDLGLTAVLAQDILDIMYTDFQDKYEEYCRAQREKQAREMADKQRALNQVSLKPGFDKLDILEQAVQSVASWNQQFNKSRRDQRKAYMDLQNLTIHYPKSKMKIVPAPKVGHYPVALVPGQFIDYYKEYTPTELNNLPLNTMCYDEIKIPVFHTDSDESTSGSESESESDSSSSGSSCDDEHCKDCVKKGKKTNGVRETDSDDVVIIENDASSSDSVVLVSVTEAITA